MVNVYEIYDFSRLLYFEELHFLEIMFLHKIF